MATETSPSTTPGERVLVITHAFDAPRRLVFTHAWLDAEGRPGKEGIMATVASGTGSEIEIFRHNARTTHKVVRLNVEGLTHDESLIQPRPGGNCLNWVLDHLLCIYDNMLPVLGQKPVMEKEALTRYAWGTPPLRNSAEALELGELMSA